MEAKIIHGTQDAKVHHVSMGRNRKKAQVIVTDPVTRASDTRHLSVCGSGQWKDVLGNIFEIK